MNVASSRVSWVVAVGMIAVLAGCSSSGKKCDKVTCAPAPDGGASAEICTEDDGLCKCGLVQLSDGGVTGFGVVCKAGTTCDPLSNTCVSVACAGVVCGSTGTCDPVDGSCKCGGVVCQADETCNLLSSTCQKNTGPCASKSVPCANNLICDPGDGKCKCVQGGPACGNTQVCDADGGCVDDPCFGVSCTATGSQCYGGICRCGGPTGVECSAPGESCSPIDNSCGPTATCALSACSQPGTVCNPTDDQCHCATVGGPICKKGEVCTPYLVDGGPLAPFEDAGGAAIYGKCLGNDPCKNVNCPAYETCDENANGACECGGDPANNIPGTICASDETCIVAYDGGPAQCLSNCEPYTPCPAIQVPDASTVVAQGCYFFPGAGPTPSPGNRVGVGRTVCAPSTSPDAGSGASCLLASDCSPTKNITCLSYILDGGSGLSAPACIPYCDVFPPGVNTTPPETDAGTHPCGGGTTCVPLPPGIVAGVCELQ